MARVLEMGCTRDYCSQLTIHAVTVHDEQKYRGIDWMDDDGGASGMEEGSL